MITAHVRLRSLRERLTSSRFRARVAVVIARALVRPGMGTVLGVVFRDRIPAFGFRVDTSEPAVSPYTKAQLFFGFYESGEIRLLRKYLRANLDVIELGASLGVTSTAAAAIAAEGRRLLAVEANPALLPTIRRNVSSNTHGVHVSVIHAAVDYTGAPSVRLEIGENTDGSHVIESGTSPDKAHVVSVPAVTLQELRKQHDITDFALICDIEGAERGILAHGPSELDGCQQLLIELHGSSAMSVEDLHQGALAAGFRCLRRQGPVGFYQRDHPLPGRSIVQ